ncbi:hypothetical protein HanIR_Chr08g0379801 [Helianthus annuus]|nr:hypothetical protein HanIR_Chr08g0379801 [Helianthus annuus]
MLAATSHDFITAPLLMFLIIICRKDDQIGIGSEIFGWLVIGGVWYIYVGTVFEEMPETGCGFGSSCWF